MAWETRDGRGRYYTRTHKANGRAVREYIGAGVKGELAAAEDAARRAQRHARDALLRAERERWRAAKAVLQELDDLVRLLAHASLHAAGYHRHAKGEWRRRRERDGNQRGPRAGGGTPAGPPVPRRGGRPVSSASDKGHAGVDARAVAESRPACAAGGARVPGADGTDETSTEERTCPRRRRNSRLQTWPVRT
jgi:hypothetical protein